jgi:hypothetical protein
MHLRCLRRPLDLAAHARHLATLRLSREARRLQLGVQSGTLVGELPLRRLGAAQLVAELPCRVAKRVRVRAHVGRLGAHARKLGLGLPQQLLGRVPLRLPLLQSVARLG